MFLDALTTLCVILAYTALASDHSASSSFIADSRRCSCLDGEIRNLSSMGGGLGMHSGESEMGRSFSELKMLDDWSLSSSSER